MEFTVTTPTTEQLYEARIQARLSQEEAAELCGIHIETYKRQESGKSRVKLSVYRVILYRSGLIMDTEWSGWQFRAGRLWSPEEVGYKPGDLRALHWMDQMVRFLRAELYKKTGEYYDQAWFHGYRFRSINEK